MERQDQPQPNSEISSYQFVKVEATPDAANQLAAKLSSFVIGQDEAARTTAREVVLDQAGMSDPTKPKTVLLYSGPTGVGKTEMTEALAKIIYGDQYQAHYLRIDCNEHNTSGSTTKFTGSGPQWIGYGDPTVITKEFLEQEGGTIIVFDEVEKAHPDVWQILLSITDKASLTVYAPTGKEQAANKYNKEVAPLTLKFNDSIIIFTTNAGAEDMQRARTQSLLGFYTGERADTDIKKGALKGLKDKFKSIPELLGRIGERRLIVFNELQHNHYVDIFDNIINEINGRIEGKIIVGDDLKNRVIQEAVGNGEYGARDLKVAINQLITIPIAELRVSEAVKFNTEILADIANGQPVFYEGSEVIHEEDKPTPPKEVDKEKKENPVPISVVEFSYGHYFQINPTEKARSSNENVVSLVVLKNNDNVAGRIKITQAAIQSPSGTIAVTPPVNTLYRLILELDSVRKSNPNKVELEYETDVFKGLPKLEGQTKRRSSMQVSFWRSDKLPNKALDLVFTWKNLQAIKFVINP